MNLFADSKTTSHKWQPNSAPANQMSVMAMLRQQPHGFRLADHPLPLRGIVIRVTSRCNQLI